MRIELNKKLNNEFDIPKMYNRNRMRIMKADVNGVALSDSEYYMMGPRQIHVTKELKVSDRVYGIVTNIEKGNRLIQ